MLSMADGRMASIHSRQSLADMTLVFNVAQDCSVDTIKSYISDNGVQVLDIRRLSKEEWNHQSFCVTVHHAKETNVSYPEFWPEDIGYRRFFKKRINQQNNERNNPT